MPAPQTITEDQRQRMRLACVALLGRLAAQRPLVVVIEDLHWADPSTVAWLDASLDALTALPYLTLLFTAVAVVGYPLILRRRARELEGEGEPDREPDDDLANDPGETVAS